MSRYAIVTDLNRCVGCLACSVSCKVAHEIAPGNFWTRIKRVGPNPIPGGSGHYPDVEMYFLPVGCQHCTNPQCVEVCPTGASSKHDNGVVQIDPELCIGCQLCVDACPYGVRYLNADSGVVEKCTLCEDRIEDGDIPECVRQCGGRARFFGDLDEGLETFRGPAEKIDGTFRLITETSKPWTDEEVHHMPDSGNEPAFAYILRGRTWQDG